MDIPPMYRKVLEIMRDVPTNRRSDVESEVVRRFRLDKDACREIIKDLDVRGLIKTSRRNIKV
jgi:hypothetical protein